MTINRAFAPPLLVPPLFVLCFALSACDGAVPRATDRQPSHPAPVAVTAPLPPRAPVALRPPAAPIAQATPDWRDVQMPAGRWNWAARDGGSAAQFASDGQAALAIVQCDRPAGVITVALPADSRSVPGATPRAASITTSTSTAAFVAEPRLIDGQAMLAITLPVSDHMLDAMAFSRGRFRVAITGIAPVILPSWAEVGRVVEDCRG